MAKFFSPQVKKILALVSSYIILKTSIISSIASNVGKGIMYHFMSAMLTVAAVLLVHFQIYKMLLKVGLSDIGASLVVFILLLISAEICNILAQKKLKKAKEFNWFFKEKDVKKVGSLVKSFFAGFGDDEKK